MITLSGLTIDMIHPGHIFHTFKEADDITQMLNLNLEEDEHEEYRTIKNGHGYSVAIFEDDEQTMIL
jgi:hypothetical protein